MLITRFPFESQLSGEEWHTITLAEKLRQRGREIMLLSSCPHLIREFQNRNFKVKKIRAPRPPVSKTTLVTFTLLAPFFLIRLAVFLIVYNSKHKGDTIYSLSLGEKLLLPPLAALLGLKTVWVEHARIGNWLTKNPYFMIYRLFNRLFVQKTIFVSEQSRRALPGLKNTVVIPNGIDTQLFNPETSHPEAQNILPSKPPDQIFIGTITRLSLDKGIPDLAAAVQQLSQKHPNLKCFIIGEGAQSEKFKKQFAGENIIFFGPLAHTFAVDFLKILDIFVLPSNLPDPFGLAAAEALASGTATIVSDVCGITDYLQNNEHALITLAGNPPALAAAIEKLIAQPELRQKIAQTGLKFAQKNFNLDHMADQYEQIIKS